MLNMITICGRMVRDPEYRMTQSQKSVCNFTLAVERDFGTPGEKRESDFVDCVVWGRVADFVSKYFGKGQIAIACGRLQSREWTDKDGNKRKSWAVVADRVYFGESKRREEEGSFQPAQRPVDVGGFQELDGEDGELPFA